MDINISPIFITILVAILSTGVIEIIMNRLRGTGTIKYFTTVQISKYKVEIKFVGNHLYAIYLGLITGIISQSIGIGIVVFIAYLVGESKGWGEWVGALSGYKPKDEEWMQKQYADNEGKKFPFIHYIANAFVKERIEGTLTERIKQHAKYSRVALSLRGFYWWGMVYFTLAIFGVIGWLAALVATIVLSLTFPIACELGKRMKFKFKYGLLSFNRGWENQEAIYGMFQGITFWLIVYWQVL